MLMAITTPITIKPTCGSGAVRGARWTKA